MNYVIIGNGAAAVGAVEGIRRTDKENPVTLVSNEPYRAYGRPLISNLLSGKIKEADIYLRAENFYELWGVKPLLGKKATAIDLENKRVFLEDGDAVPFDRLLIATGGIPFIPPIRGKDGSGVYTFTTLDDAKKLAARVGKVKKAVVVGGGLIGLKAAEGLNDRGVKVTVVELADRILSSAFDRQAGDIIERRLREVGLEIILNNSVEEIVRVRGRVKGVALKSGEMVEASDVVIAIGVVPNKAIVEGTRIITNRGALTDEYMETNVAGVYAAGDVVEPTDLLLGQRRVTPIWPNAYIQGKFAGMNMAGSRKSYGGSIPMNSIEFYGIPTVSIGVSNPPDEGYEVRTSGDPAENVYRKIVFKDDRLVGAVLVGRIEKAGVLTGLIADRVDVGAFKDELLKEDFGFVRIPVETRRRILAAAR